MDLITALLPRKARPYAKAIICLIGLILGAVALTVHSPILTIAINIATALGVYVQPNRPAVEG